MSPPTPPKVPHPLTTHFRPSSSNSCRFSCCCSSTEPTFSAIGAAPRPPRLIVVPPPNAQDPHPFSAPFSTPWGFCLGLFHPEAPRAPRPQGRHLRPGRGTGATGRNWEAQSGAGRTAPLPPRTPISSPPPSPIPHQQPRSLPIPRWSSFPLLVQTRIPITTIPRGARAEAPSPSIPPHPGPYRSPLLHTAQLPGLSFICAISAP